MKEDKSWIEGGKEKCKCGLCSKDFDIIEWHKPYGGGYFVKYEPEKIELLPEKWPSVFICADCQDKLKNEIIIYHYCRDALWAMLYIFKDLETFYEDFPGNWVREGKIHPSNPPIYRVLKIWPGKGWPPALWYYSEDPRFFEAIQNMPVVKR